jgi:hypothetical protein
MKNSKEMRNPSPMRPQANATSMSIPKMARGGEIVAFMRVLSFISVILSGILF